MIDPIRQPLIDVFLRYNQQLNLSAIRDAEGVYEKHILDSLMIKHVIDMWSIKTLGDVGTWWWFPLLPLALQYPHIVCTGIDSTQKKLQAISNMCNELGISNCLYERTRIEQYTWKFDLVTVRAVAHVSILLQWLSWLYHMGTKIVLYKQYDKYLPDQPWVLEKQEMITLLPTYHLKLIHEYYYTLWPWDRGRVLYVLEVL